MTRRGLWAILPACLAIVVIATGCKKPKPVVVPFDAAPPPESPADVDAKDVVSVLVSVYPPVCEADAASRTWAACREGTRGYPALYACAAKALRDSRAALASLRPSTKKHSECGETIEKTSVDLLNAAPRYFGDVVRWLEQKHGMLAISLSSKSLVDACRAKAEVCAGEPHDWDDAYKAMRTRNVDGIECTAQLFRCGRREDMDCWVSGLAPRLGVACPPTENRSGGGPDDLLYVRASGTPIGR
jgi:hypothetical protein